MMWLGFFLLFCLGLGVLVGGSVYVHGNHMAKNVEAHLNWFYVHLLFEGFIIGLLSFHTYDTWRNE